jgi:nucleotide-binding universal stress UspA family protein
MFQAYPDPNRRLGDRPQGGRCRHCVREGGWRERRRLLRSRFHRAPLLDKGTRQPAVDVRPIEKQLHQQGEKYLAEIRKAAEAAGVACDTVMTSPATSFSGNHRYFAQKEVRRDIHRIARSRQPGSLLLGSVTQKVLAHSKIPVLVYR